MTCQRFARERQILQAVCRVTPREAEVEHLDAAVCREHDVGALQIAMSDAGSCACASAPATCTPQRTTSPTGRPPGGIRSFRRWPSTNSIAMNGCPSNAPISWMVQMLRMIQLRGMLRFALQSRMRIIIGAVGNLDRNGPAKLEVASDIHLAHATGPDGWLDLVMSDDAARHRDRRLLDERAGLLVRFKQAFHFRAHCRFVTTGCVQKCRALGRLALERAVEELLHPGPLIHH